MQSKTTTKRTARTKTTTPKRRGKLKPWIQEPLSGLPPSATAGIPAALNMRLEENDRVSLGKLNAQTNGFSVTTVELVRRAMRAGFQTLGVG